MAGPGKAKRKTNRWLNITGDIFSSNAASAETHKPSKPGKSQHSRDKPSTTASKPQKKSTRVPKREKATPGLVLDKNFKEQWAKLPHEVHETIMSYALMHDSPISVDARMDAYPKVYSCRPATLLRKCSANEKRDHAINRNLIYANNHFRISFSRIYYESNVFAINLGWKPIIPESASEDEKEVAIFPGEHYYAAKYIRRVILTAEMPHQFKYAPQMLRCFDNLLEIGFDTRCRPRSQVDSADEVGGGWRFDEMNKHTDDGSITSTLMLAGVELGDVLDKERVCSPFFESKVWLGLGKFTPDMWTSFEVWKDGRFNDLRQNLEEGMRWHQQALAGYNGESEQEDF